MGVPHTLLVELLVLPCVALAFSFSPNAIVVAGSSEPFVAATRPLMLTSRLPVTSKCNMNEDFTGFETRTKLPSLPRDGNMKRMLQEALVVGAMLLGVTLGGASTWAAEEDAMQPKFYLQQVQEAMPLKTMRGIWRFKEIRERQSCTGKLVFEGKLDEPNRGDVIFLGTENLGTSSVCYTPRPPAQSVKGKWLMKPAKFEQKGDIGTIQFNARWKLRTEQGTFIFRGDISADPIEGTGAVPEAIIKGEILKERGNERYEKVGSFEGQLKEFLSDNENNEE